MDCLLLGAVMEQQYIGQFDLMASATSNGLCARLLFHTEAIFYLSGWNIKKRASSWKRYEKLLLWCFADKETHQEEDEIVKRCSDLIKVRVHDE